MWGSDRLHASCQEVGKCSTRGESWGMYITSTSTKIVNKAEPTLALKPRGDVTRNPKQGYQWPQKRTCVRQKLFLKKHVAKQSLSFNCNCKQQWDLKSFGQALSLRGGYVTIVFRDFVFMCTHALTLRFSSFIDCFVLTYKKKIICSFRFN